MWNPKTGEVDANCNVMLLNQMYDAKLIKEQVKVNPKEIKGVDDNKREEPQISIKLEEADAQQQRICYRQ
jgi:hypothetical protein